MINARAPGVPDAKPGIPADGKNEYSVCLDTWRLGRIGGLARQPGRLCLSSRPSRASGASTSSRRATCCPIRTSRPASSSAKTSRRTRNIIPFTGKWIC